MRLKDWLCKNDKTPRQLAEELGYHRVYMQQICRGTKEPGRHFIQVIENITKGEVALADWSLPIKNNNAQKVQHGNPSSCEC